MPPSAPQPSATRQAAKNENGLVKEASALPAAHSLLRLASPDGLLAMLLRALDPKAAAPEEWEAVRQATEGRLTEVMASSWMLIESPARRRASQESLAVLGAPGGRGEGARERFAESLGQPAWADAALGGLCEDPASAKNFAGSEKKWSSKIQRGGVFAIHVATIDAPIPAAQMTGWARGAIAWSLGEDFQNGNAHTSVALAALEEIEKRGRLASWDWEGFARVVISSGRACGAGERMFANANSATATFAMDRGPLALRMAKLIRRSDFAPSDIARALNKDPQARMKTILAAGVVDEKAWPQVAGLKTLSPEARAVVEGELLSRATQEALGGRAHRVPAEAEGGVSGETGATPASKLPARRI